MSPRRSRQSIPQAEPLVKAESSPPTVPEGLNEMLLDELRDILHAEKHLTKALLRMAQAARFDRLRECFEEHLVETEAQIERIMSAFHFSGNPHARNPAKA
jgi:Mn-containing catalase